MKRLQMIMMRDLKVIKMGNIKSLLVEFIMAFLVGIAGRIATGYIFVYIFSAFPSTENLFGRLGHFAGYIVPIFIGIPLGSSLGIFITKKYIFRSGFRSSTFNVLCLFTSFVFGFLVILLDVALLFIDPLGPGLSETTIVYPLIPLFALIGYNAMAVLLRRRKESGRSAPQKHLNDRDSSPVIEKQNQ